MKSLEILEIYLKIAKEEMEEDKVKNAIINNLNQIKLELEVLEILRKYLYSKSYIVESYQGDREERTIEMQVIEENGKLLDYRKLKKWLEENEDEK